MRSVRHPVREQAISLNLMCLLPLFFSFCSSPSPDSTQAVTQSSPTAAFTKAANTENTVEKTVACRKGQMSNVAQCMFLTLTKQSPSD